MRKLSLLVLGVLLLLPILAQNTMAQTLPSKSDVIADMSLVNDYWIGGNAYPGNSDWEKATYFRGNSLFSKIYPNQKYIDYSILWAEANDWKLFGYESNNFADNHTAGQIYMDLYELDPQPERIANISKVIGDIVADDVKDDWWWVDAIFMSMPNFIRLGVLNDDPKYFERAYECYSDTKTRRGLFDTEDGLWYRDERFKFPAFKTTNGEKCYWGRGNGWGLAVHALVLDALPETDAHRAEYIETFRQMAEALKLRQRADGFWGASLNDSLEFEGPETSGTSLFTFGIAWGVNNGILDSAKFTPVVAKAWEGLSTMAVQANGFLGYCQGPGIEPKTSQPVSVKTTADFAIGQFLMAGSEVYKMAQDVPAEYAADGAWCWFADPRAIYNKGEKELTYVSYLTSTGNVIISAYDHATKVVTETTIRESLNINDHANPSLLILPDNKIMIFYSMHNDEQSVKYRISENPEDITSWGEEQHIYVPAGETYTYPNVAMLSDESNRIYVFLRGLGYNPTMVTSDDLGKTWSEPIQIMSIGARPYVKTTSNGKDRIHITFTDGHPRNEAENHVYYACIKDGAYYKADGTKIKDITEGMLEPTEADLVYDASAGRGWTWDIAYDANDNPVIVHTALPSETDHRYRYAKWDGTQWLNNEICTGGKWFPETKPGTTEEEPHYSGGVILDSEDPTIAYVSRPTNDVFEIEKYWTADGGQTWSSEAITSNSNFNNVRPIVPRNHKAGELDVLWMYNEYYQRYTNYKTSIRTNLEPNQVIQMSSSEQTNRLIGNLEVFDDVNKYKWVLATNFQSGDVMYGDRTYTVEDIPEYLLGLEWIKTGCDSKTWTGDPLATFDLYENADIYIALNDQVVGNEPEWLKSFTATGDKIQPSFSDEYFIYKKHFLAGSISLGQNADGYNQGGNYIVIIKANDTPSSINSAKAVNHTFSISPNPTSGLVKFRCENIIDQDLKIYNSIGKVIYQSVITENHSTIDLTHYNAGIYFAKYANTTQKFIIKH